jgi:hypothetical protein
VGDALLHIEDGLGVTALKDELNNLLGGSLTQVCLLSVAHNRQTAC